jgi:hypothetical protein
VQLQSGMKKIIGYLRDYITTLSLPVFLLSALVTALFVFINYHFELNIAIHRQPYWLQYFSWYGIFLMVS